MTRWKSICWFGVFAVAGCQGAQRSPFVDSPLSGDLTPNVKLNGAQVADVQTALGQTLEKRGDTQSAVQAYEAAVGADKNRVDATARLAVLADRDGKFDESAELYRKALEKQPQNAEIHCNFGYSLYLQYRWKDAEDELRRALAINPNHQRAHNNLGLVLARNGHPEEAWQEFRLAGISEADAHANLGYALALSAAWPEAMKHYEAALAIQPDFAVARAGLDAVKQFAAATTPPADDAKGWQPVKAESPAPAKPTANQLPILWQKTTSTGS